MVQIRCLNTHTTLSFPEGSSLLDIYPHFADGCHLAYPLVSAKVNNVSQGLKFRVYQNRDVEFIDLSDASGMRVYIRSLCFLLYTACRELFPACRLYIEHHISGGFYCNFYPENDRCATDEEITRVSQRMQDIIAEDRPFHHHEVPVEEAVSLFRARGLYDKARLIETTDKIYCDYYTLGDTVDYYYGALLPSTGALTLWALEPYQDGVLLRTPNETDPQRLTPVFPQPRTYETFAEYVNWNAIMGLSNVGDVNTAILHGGASELIQISEALQEKKIVQIAEEIHRRTLRPDHACRLVLITGPSSSGKTTFCKRLSIQLMACGLKPLSFSTDDYFVNREDTPRFPDGSYDFENIDTVDGEALRRDLKAILQGETVEVPEFNFATGKREYNGKRLALTPNAVLLIEGIHALNPSLTEGLDDRLKYKIFISTLTSVSLDDHNWIPTRDNRLLRRIVRDSDKGAFSAKQTIAQWPKVCEGEARWILPYQERADVMFNSALTIEFAVLRTHAESILATVPRNCPEYSEAHRLLKFIHYFTAVDDKEIPPTSIMREFVGGSSFKYLR